MAQPQRLAGYAGYQYFLVTSPAAFVAHVEINRPDKLNAFFEAMWLELRQVFQQLSSDPDVRAVVLSGAGDRAFTAGLDVKAANETGPLSSTNKGAGAAADGARNAAKLRRHIAEFQDCISAVERCEKRRHSHHPAEGDSKQKLKV
jgi:delta(3,5)-delta(2,4)-dienoyl-CoA isomerase